MGNIAIIDDDLTFLNLLKKKLLKLNNNLSIYCYQNPYDFIKNVNNINYVLLDIELPQMDGISLSKKLRDNDISIFFITTHEELMINAFGKNVEGFILKEKLEEGILKFLQFVESSKEEKKLKISTCYNTVYINFCEILYIHYLLRDIEYYLVNGKKIIQKNKNLKEILELLDENFILINRNTAINLNYIEDLKKDYVLIKKNKFKVSRRKLKNIKIKIFERELKNGH